MYNKQPINQTNKQVKATKAPLGGPLPSLMVVL